MLSHYKMGKNGNGIHIKKGNEGIFTAKAKRAGKSVQGYATEMVRKYKGKKNLTDSQKKTLRQAVFAKNAKKWNK